MSTGQRQRVKLAAAIAHDPQLVLLDEPTDGLDPVQRDLMLELIGRIGSEFGIDILLSSHLLDEVDKVCDNVAIIAAGTVTTSGTLESLRGAVTGLVVEVSERPDELATWLVGRGCEAEVDRHLVTITGEGDLALLARDGVVATNCGLRRLTNRQVTLEDVFLSANDEANAAAMEAPLAVGTSAEGTS